MWNLFEKPLPAGSEAPDFEAEDESGKPFRLSALRGKPVLLVFYPGDDTPGCRKQLCEIRDSWQALESHGVSVFGVNPQGAESHRRFIGKYGFPFPILVDRGQRIAKLYRASGLIVKRTVVLIDSGGGILFSERGMPSSRTVLRALPAPALG
ncbi:MAG: peroxiredoxin [Bryobacterales bacterium]|nr:peroxiredoxin [Bryobacterales bacterium]